jgi:hypothetical protein
MNTSKLLILLSLSCKGKPNTGTPNLSGRLFGKPRFAQLEELDWAFGTIWGTGQRKHLATLYLEDISDFIVECG